MSGLIGALAAILDKWWVRHKTRRELARLDGRLLRDIGVSADQAAAEQAKKPWAK